ncbi:hypothetical protein [Georgenia thermotolerans]|uniref:Uncharacterized protein n=1 Tax=Georgenia thermotolerans TaxID=527326 RepID=A0A7J5UPD2_9MICO|nr:hypothetical protein [Georgenia thermotolerans]KAE8764265.1 hypothetical protein GB883_09990 [Georgenia thermotolerans]
MRTRDRSGAAVGVAAVVLLGVVVAGCGTMLHRWQLGAVPLGVGLALLMVLVGGVVARALMDMAGVVLYGLAAVLTSQVMTFLGPGGDVLVPSGAPSSVWLLGLPVAAALAAATPKSWYADLPAGVRHPARRHGRHE